MTYRVLILEDDMETLATIFSVLAKLEYNFAPIVLCDYTHIKLLQNAEIHFDLILLDRDCHAGGSFHVFDIEDHGVDKVIGISSVPEYNEQLKTRGVTKTVTKDYLQLPMFARQLEQTLRQFFISQSPDR